MSNQSIEKLIETITTLFITTTESQEQDKKGKVNVEALLASFKSEDFQEELKKLINKGMPKKTRVSSDKLKDENAPKRPKSGYMFYCEKKRPQIKAANPEFKVPQISKALGESWKSASPDTKAKYNKKSEQDKARYNSEKADYTRPSDDELSKQKINQKKRGKPSGTKKRTKPEGAPTRGKSSYVFFCADKRAEVKDANPDLKPTEIISELARLWKELADEDKQPYIDQAAEAKELYLQQKSEWEEVHGELNPKKSKGSPVTQSKSEVKSPKPKNTKDVKSKAKSDTESEAESEPESPKEKGKKKKLKEAKSDTESEAESEPESPKGKKKFA